MRVTFAVLATLALTRIAPDVILMAAVAFLVVSGILNPGEALAGLSNPGVMTIATLYVVAAGLSAFIDNTAVVAMFISAVQEWAAQLKRPPSKLLLPELRGHHRWHLHAHW